jgi:subtilisin family serine protease
MHVLESGDFNNVAFLKDYNAYLNELEDNIRYATTQPVNYRDDLLKDNSNDILKTNYGNNNLQTHSGYHGTSVSGIIGAVRNNGKGIDGIADNVQIMMLRAILGKDEYDKDVALAIRYAVDHGAKVINMSFGKSISPDKKWVDDAMQYALDKDVVLVHASGNDAQNIDIDYNYPNGYKIDGTLLPNFINVGASGDYSTGSLIAPFTNYGKKMVDLFAPGIAIHCSIANNGTQLSSGTSMAAPVVAGIAALLRSYFPELSAMQIVDILKNSGTPIQEKVTKPGTKNEKIYFKELSATGKIANAFEAVKLAMTYK